MDTLSAAHAREKLAWEEKRDRTLASRNHRLRELHRRRAERETVENYLQSPYSVSQGIPAVGVNVAEDRMAHLRERYQRAQRFGAVEALGKFEAHMRQNQLRVSDLFAVVDVDGSGVIDRAELLAACQAVKLNLSTHHLEALFR